MSQRNIEGVIGRLLTDEGFRHAFLNDPERSLRDLLDGGTHLTRSEIAALLAIDSALWRTAAERIDPRLQKASLTSECAAGTMACGECD